MKLRNDTTWRRGRRLTVRRSRAHGANSSISDRLRRFLLTAQKNNVTRGGMANTPRFHCRRGQTFDRPQPASRRWPGFLRAPTLASLALASLLTVGCHRGGSDPAGGGAQGLFADGRALTRSDVLLQLIGVPHSDVASRLGAHRIESVTRWTITPLSSPKAGPDVVAGFRADTPVQPYDSGAGWESGATTLEEKRVIEVDETGRLHLSNQNDHGYGIEAIADREYLYMRMANAPYVRRTPEGDEVERLRATAYESGASLLETVASALYLSPPSETSRLGRAAWAVALSRQEQGSTPRRPSGGTAVAGKAWRGGVIAEAIDGQAVVDRQRGTLLDLKLSVRFQAPRGPVPPGTASVEGERVQIEAQHETRVVALGSKVEHVATPAEWIDPPTRPRPALEKQELLSGMIPGRP